MDGDTMAGTKYGEDIAVLKDQMKDVKSVLLRIETKIDAGAETYATKSELRTFKWITVPLVILGTGLVTFLLTFFLGHLNPSSSGANNPTTSTTTTVNTPAGSTSTTATKDATPSSTSNSTSNVTPPTVSTPPSTDGGVQVDLPKL